MRKLIVFTLLAFAAPARAIPTRINIERLQGGITIDGDVSDSGWKSAIRIDNFVEFVKGDNAAPPVKTVGLMTYDANAVYVAFIADDPRPARIRAPYVDRDRVMIDQDYVAVVIDTQNDRRSGVVFRVNPRGIQTDGVYNDANGVEDFSPDFFYESVARETPTGWVAEMRIPLSSLRYPSTDPQTWGVILVRNYPRDFRYVMSNTPIPKSSNCFVCHASTLTGLRGLPTGSHLVATPYSTAARNEHLESSDLRSPMTTDPLRSNVGVDLKWSPSTKLTLDTTLNPDFSQVESDVPQFSVNSRFALDYPEKRAFFLEGVDLLSTPVRAVYTRAIAAPAWGVRATGQTGASAYTLLLAEDRGGGTVILPGTFGSDAAARDFRSRVFVGHMRTSFGRSFAGILATGREIEGGGHNRVIGPDILWKPTTANRVMAQLLFSDTQNPDRPDLSSQFAGNTLRGHGARVVGTRDAAKYDIWTEYKDYSPGFRADNGFVPQVGYRLGYAEIGGHLYPQGGFFSFIRPYFAIDHGIAYEGGATTRHGIYPGFWFEGKWGSSGWITWRGAEAERVNGNLLGYKFVEWSLRANPFRLLPAVRVDGAFGQKIDYAAGRVGRGGNIDFTTTIRPTDHLEVEGAAKRDWLVGTFSAQLERVKMTYTFSPRSLVRLIGQYQDVDHRPVRDGGFTASALYAYRLNWQTLFFVGYGDARTLDGRETLRRSGRTVFMKVAYAVQR